MTDPLTPEEAWVAADLIATYDDKELAAMCVSLATQLDAAEERERRLAEALRDLHAEVEMGESVGICLKDRVPSLRAGQLLTALDSLQTQGGSDD